MSGSREKALRREMKNRADAMGITPEVIEQRVAEGVEKMIEEEFEGCVMLVGQAIKAKFEERIRPKPRLCPMWLWRLWVFTVISKEPPMPKRPEDMGITRAPSEGGPVAVGGAEGAEKVPVALVP